MTTAGHNGVAAGQLRAFIERIEHEKAEIRDRNENVADIYKELKGQGFDGRAVKRIVAMRAMDPAKRREEEEILDIYLTALGMVE